MVAKLDYRFKMEMRFGFGLSMYSNNQASLFFDLKDTMSSFFPLSLLFSFQIMLQRDRDKSGI